MWAVSKAVNKAVILKHQHLGGAAAVSCMDGATTLETCQLRSGTICQGHKDGDHGVNVPGTRSSIPLLQSMRLCAEITHCHVDYCRYSLR